MLRPSVRYAVPFFRAATVKYARPRELYYTRFGEPGDEATGDRAVGVPSAARALLGAPRLTIKPNSQH